LKRSKNVEAIGTQTANKRGTPQKREQEKKGVSKNLNSIEQRGEETWAFDVCLEE